MLFASRESLEDAIIRILSKRKSTPRDLYKTIETEGKNVSIQALYKALRYLIKDAIVVKTDQNISISQEWINKINDTLKQGVSTPKLTNGESIEYTFNSLANLDAYWKHVVKPLQDQYKHYPVFHYNHYQIWYRIQERFNSELEYFKSFEPLKQYCFMVIGNNTNFDQQFKKTFQNEYVQIDTWPKNNFPITDYFSIIGEYIVNTKLNRKLAQNIQTLYTKNLKETEMISELNTLLHKVHKAKIKIEHNSKKAKLLRKKLFKNFYLPAKLAKQFELL